MKIWTVVILIVALITLRAMARVRRSEKRFRRETEILSEVMEENKW